MNGIHEKLSACQRRMIDDNRDWLDKNGLRVVKSAIEDSKYGQRLIIVVQEEDGSD